MGRIPFFFYCFLLPALLLGLPGEISAQNSAGQGNGNSSGNTLSRLIGISEQLSALNEKLSNELQDSKKSSRELQIMLEASRQELETLKRELEVLRISSTELSARADISQTELTALQEALRTAGSSLMSLELSFGAYRQEAETRIVSLKRENRLWKWGCIAAGVLTAGFGTAFLLTR